jgi:hypothetical protein
MAPMPARARLRLITRRDFVGACVLVAAGSCLTVGVSGALARWSTVRLTGRNAFATRIARGAPGPTAASAEHALVQVPAGEAWRTPWSEVWQTAVWTGLGVTQYTTYLGSERVVIVGDGLHGSHTSTIYASKIPPPAFIEHAIRARVAHERPLMAAMTAAGAPRPPEGELGRLSFTDDVSGWPMRAMVRATTHRPVLPPPATPLTSAQGRLAGATSPFLLSPPLPKDRLCGIPWRPLWPGFAVDTALYAGLLWVASFVTGAFRGVRRRRRGLCTRCGYDRRGLFATASCPECGLAFDTLIA